MNVLYMCMTYNSYPYHKIIIIIIHSIPNIAIFVLCYIVVVYVLISKLYKHKKNTDSHKFPTVPNY